MGDGKLFGRLCTSVRLFAAHELEGLVTCCRDLLSQPAIGFISRILLLRVILVACCRDLLRWGLQVISLDVCGVAFILVTED